MRISTATLIAPLLLALAAPAAAQTAPAPEAAPAAKPGPKLDDSKGPPFDPPPWQPDQTHGQVMLRDMMAPFPENVHADARVWSLHPPGGGGAMIGSVLLVGVTGEGAEFIRVRLDELRRTPEIVAGSDPDAKVRTIAWQEKVDDAQKLIDAHLEWAQDDHGTISIVRAVWIRPTNPDDAVEEYRVECLMTTESAATMRPVCEQAMASLRPRTLAERQTIAVAAVPADAPADDDSDDTAAPGAPAQMRETPNSIGPVLASRPPAREPARDMRPFYVGGFILLVVAVLWWNRKKRAELDAEAGRDTGSPDDEPAGDADADDLADAAAADVAAAKADDADAGKAAKDKESE